jgi:hypothetical protein
LIRWVLLGKSDIVPADVAAAAAAAAGHHRLNFSPLPMIPIWWEVVDGDSNSAIRRVSFFQVRNQSVTIFMFLAQGADGSWGRGLHGCAVLQEGEEGRRYVHIPTTVYCKEQMVTGAFGELSSQDSYLISYSLSIDDKMSYTNCCHCSWLIATIELLCQVKH